MKNEKYTPEQAKTGQKIIKYFAKFQASVFLLSKGKLWNKWPGGYPIMVVETRGAKSNKIRNCKFIFISFDTMFTLYFRCISSIDGYRLFWF